MSKGRFLYSALPKSMSVTRSSAPDTRKLFACRSLCATPLSSIRRSLHKPRQNSPLLFVRLRVHDAVVGGSRSFGHVHHEHLRGCRVVSYLSAPQVVIGLQVCHAFDVRQVHHHVHFATNGVPLLENFGSVVKTVFRDPVPLDVTVLSISPPI